MKLFIDWFNVAIWFWVGTMVLLAVFTETNECMPTTIKGSMKQLAGIIGGIFALSLSYLMFIL